MTFNSQVVHYNLSKSVGFLFIDSFEWVIELSHVAQHFITVRSWWLFIFPGSWKVNTCGSLFIALDLEGQWQSKATNVDLEGFRFETLESIDTAEFLNWKHCSLEINELEIGLLQ